MQDLHGRPYAQLSHLAPGMKVQVDGDFTCIPIDAVKTVQMDNSGRRFLRCRCGQHFLDGQLQGKYLIGVYHVR